MDLNMVMQFIKPETLIVVVACYVFGMFLKASVVKDWLIPYLLLVFGIVLMIAYMTFVLGEGFTAKVVVMGIIQGLFAAALAVYSNQLIKQATTGKSQ